MKFTKFSQFVFIDVNSSKSIHQINNQIVALHRFIQIEKIEEDCSGGHLHDYVTS